MKLFFPAVLLASAAAAAPAPAPKAPPASVGYGYVATSTDPVQTVALENAAKTVDLLLGQAALAVGELETTAKGGPDGTGCPPGFSIESYARDAKAKRSVKELGADIPDQGGAIKNDYQYYAVCRALAAGIESPCASLLEIVAQPPQKNRTLYATGAAAPTQGAFQERVSEKDRCVDSFRVHRVKIAFVARDARFMEECREAAPSMPPFKSPDAQETFCAAWSSARVGATDGLAAAIMGGVKTPLKPEFARDAAREMVSDPAWCADDAGDDQKRACRELNDYREALAKKSPDACKGGLCRMLMGGGPRACEPYAAKLKKAVCTSVYQAGFAADRGEAAEKSLKTAEAIILRAAPRAPKLADARGFLERLDRVYELRDRAFNATEALGPPKKPAAQPAPTPR
jgi:hypothetical protein